MVSVGQKRVVEAFNSAKASENLMHNDEYAKSKGYRGGLVPGTDTYGYMTHPPVYVWGEDWLRHGTAEFRLSNPVFQGDLVETTIAEATESTIVMTLAVDQTDVGWGRFEKAHSEDEAALPPVPELPPTSDRPPATEESLAEGLALGVIVRQVSESEGQQVLSDLSEDLDLYPQRGLVHPGYLMRIANWSLSMNVVLGPWIHIGSKVFNFAPCPIGEELRATSMVIRNYDMKGHKVVDTDVRIRAASVGLIQRILHTSIWEPRQATP